MEKKSIFTNYIIENLNGRLIYGNMDEELINFSKDTRTINNGDVYIGIKGENFDGNLFYKDAFNKGAKVCILEKNSFKDDNFEYFEGKTLVIVENSIETLQKLASYKRSLYDIPVNKYKRYDI